MINVTYKGKVVGRIIQQGIRVLDEELSNVEFVPDKLLYETKNIRIEDDIMVVDHGVFKLELETGKLDDIIVLNDRDDFFILEKPVPLKDLTVLRNGIISGDLFYPILLKRTRYVYNKYTEELFQQKINDKVDYIIDIGEYWYGEKYHKVLTSARDILRAATTDERLRNYILPIMHRFQRYFYVELDKPSELLSVTKANVSPLFNEKDEVVGIIHLPVAGKLYVAQQPTINLSKLKMVDSENITITPTEIIVEADDLRVKYETPIFQKLTIDNEDFMNKLSQLTAGQPSFFVIVGESVYLFRDINTHLEPHKKRLNVSIGNKRVSFHFDLQYIWSNQLHQLASLVHRRFTNDRAETLRKLVSFLVNQPPAVVRKLWKQASLPPISNLFDKINKSKAFSRFIEDNPELLENILILHSVLEENK